MVKLFEYAAIDPTGKTRKGQIQAEHESQAKTKLVQQQWVVLELKPIQPTKTTLSLWARNPLKGEALAVWTLQLATLIEAKLPLERALLSLQDEMSKPQQVGLIQALQEDVQGGSSFADALAHHPHVFDASFVAVVTAGEQSGQLGRVLRFQAETLQAQETLKHKLLASATYPLIVLTLAAVILLFLMTYVVPQIAGVFSQSQQNLPTLTLVMLKLSDWTRSMGLWVLLLLALLVLSLQRARRTKIGREWVDTHLLRVPLLGPLLNDYFASRFASTLAMLLNAGVPMLKALRTSTDVVSNQCLNNQINECSALVREGAPLGAALQSKSQLPKILVTFVKLGEQTGQLAPMLQSVSQQLSEQLQRRTTKVIALLEPALIVVMGVVVTLIVLAVLLPIIQMNELVLS